MNNDAKKMNGVESIEIMCDISGLNPKDFKTKIDVYSRDSSGKKIVVCKKFYSMGDIIDGIESGILYGAMIKAVIRECNISPSDIVNFAYPDQETMSRNTLCIEFTNYIEKDNGQQKIIDNNKRG